MANSLTHTLSSYIAQIEATAPSRGRFDQAFHLCPPTGWLNDPNGLCQQNSVFHAFFQYGPFDVNGGLKVWGHAESKDMLSWAYVGTPLLADNPADCHGVYSGSAVATGNIMTVAYTGNVKLEGNGYDYVNAGREANTIVALSIDGGRTFGTKHLVMTNADYPEDCTCHVRDPKIWFADDTWHMVQGARRKAAADTPSAPSRYCALHGERAGVDAGEVLLFSSPDAIHWDLIRRVSTSERFGFMWECPDYFELEGGEQGSMHVLSVSPQGLEGEEWERRNIYASGYFALDSSILAEGTPKVNEFHVWDAGFDFYAPQTFEAEDGRRILIAWMGMPDVPSVTNLTIADGWQHCMTVPRELTAGPNGMVLQAPVRELAQYRGRCAQAESSLQTACSKAFDLELSEIGDAISITLAHEFELNWSKDSGWFVMEFKDGSQESVGAGRTLRREPLEELASLRVIGDASSVEVFANDGELVMSTRYYPQTYEIEISSSTSSISLWELEGFHE